MTTPVPLQRGSCAGSSRPARPAGSCSTLHVVPAAAFRSSRTRGRRVAGVHRALRRGGCLYLTVAEIDDAEIDAAFADAQERGVPAVRGEVVEGDTAGYHHYPGRDRVMSWLEAEGLTVVEEDLDQQDT